MDDLKKTLRMLVEREVRALLSENAVMVEGVVREALMPEIRSAILATVRRVAGECRGELPAAPEIRAEASKAPDEPAGAWMEEAVTALPRRVEERTENGAGPEPANEPDAGEAGEGLYLYGITDREPDGGLGCAGIEGSEVFAVEHQGLWAVAHRCAARPYASRDADRVRRWVVEHQNVVDAVWQRCGTVIPMGFDTIVAGGPENTADENMRNWIEDERDNLKARLDRFRGMAEFGVQVFWDAAVIGRGVAEASPRIQELEKEIQSKPRGVAYMYRRKLDDLLRRELESLMDERFRQFYEKVKPRTRELKVEKTKKSDNLGQRMLMNLSCLVPKEDGRQLGDALEEIQGMEGYSVRFTGPWPPYSFA